MSNACLGVPGHRVRRLVGRGGFGSVYQAVREADGHTVAIKLAHAGHRQAARRLEREADALRRVGAPFVPAVHATGTLPGGASYLVMDFLTAPTLDARGVPRSLAEVSAWAAAILRALEAIHARGVVHGDLKPQHIFLADQATVASIVDFGLARLDDAESGAGDGIAGTAAYMSPEQCSGGTRIDARSDLYSVGAICFELLTGQPPFFGSAAEVQEAHRSRRVPAASVPPPVEAWLGACLAKQPARRFASAGVALAALREATASASHGVGEARSIAAGPPAASVQMQPMALVFFEHRDATGGALAALSSLGGTLAHVAGTRHVAAFIPNAGANPVARAVRAAQSLIGRGLCARALVDFAPVKVRAPAGRAPRLMSPLFLREDRFPTAADPAAVMLTTAAQGMAGDVALEPVAGHADRFRVATPKAQDSAVFGRDDVLDDLVRAARRSLGGAAPGIATVIAPAGHGKTGVAGALMRRLQLAVSGVQVLELRAREPLGGSPDQTLRVLLRQVLELGEGRDSLAASPIPTDERAVIALAMGWLPADARELDALRAAPGLLRSLTVRVAADALLRACARKPLCIVLDDAQFAGEILLDTLEQASRAGAHAPLWICVLARPGFEHARPAWGKRAQHAYEVRLGPLLPDGAAQLCRHLLAPADNLPARVIERLVERTQGIPLLLIELVRAIQREGLLRRDAKTSSWFLATDELDRIADLPLVAWLAHRELASLPAELADQARLVSLLGPEVEPADVAGVLEAFERAHGTSVFALDTEIANSRLLAAGLLVARPKGRVAFRHALIREAVYQTLPETLRERLHEAACDFYRDAPALPRERRLPRLAYHAAQSGRRAIAADAYLALAGEAAARHACLDAESLYTRALAELAAADRRVMLARKERGRMRNRIGRYADALGDLAAAREMAATAGDRAAEVEILLDEAMALDWMDRYRESGEAVARAEALATDELPAACRAHLLMAQGRSAHRLGDWNRAAGLLAQAARRAEELGPAGYETFVVSLLMLAPGLVVLGRIDEAEHAFARVVATCERAGDHAHLAGALHNRFLLWTARRDAARAIADTAGAMDIFHELGLVASEYRAVYNLAEIHYQTGDVEAAGPHLERASELAERIGTRPDPVLLKARMLLFSGAVAAARELLDELRQGQRAARASGDEAKLLLPPEQILADMVDLGTRSATDAEWDELERRADALNIQQDPVEVREMRALACWRRGRRNAARLHFAAALAMAHERPNLMEQRLATARFRCGSLSKQLVG